MKENSKIIILIGLLTGVISVLARYSLHGWLHIIGLLSIIVFGLFHVAFLHQINNHYNSLTSRLRKIAWIGVLLFPLIFMFQFDFGDNSGTFYVYEYVTGENDWLFEKYAFFIAIASGLIYLINFGLWRMNINKTVANTK